MTEYVRVHMLQVAEGDDGYSLSPWIPSEATLQCMLYSTKVMEMSGIERPYRDKRPNSNP